MINCRLTYEKQYFPNIALGKLLINYVCTCFKKESGVNEDEVITDHTGQEYTKDQINRKTQNDMQAYLILSILIMLITIQVCIMEFGGSLAFKTSGLSWKQYGISILVGYGIIIWV